MVCVKAFCHCPHIILRNNFICSIILCAACFHQQQNLEMIIQRLARVGCGHPPSSFMIPPYVPPVVSHALVRRAKFIKSLRTRSRSSETSKFRAPPVTETNNFGRGKPHTVSTKCRSNRGSVEILSFLELHGTRIYGLRSPAARVNLILPNPNPYPVFGVMQRSI